MRWAPAVLIAAGLASAPISVGADGVRKGAVQVITSSAPTLEGGLAVAPRGFGAYGGDLIAPDELSGRSWRPKAAGPWWQ